MTALPRRMFVVFFGVFTLALLFGYRPFVSASGADDALKELALSRANVAEMGNPPCATGYEIGEYRRVGRWAFLSIVCWPAEQADPDVFVPDTILLAVARQIGGQWTVTFESESAFADEVAAAPGRLLDAAAKTALIAQPAASSAGITAPNATYVTGLPWQQGTTWYYRQSIHGGNQGLDLASPCGQVGQVMAADEGTVVWAYETCMLVRRPDGLQIGYQHLTKSQIAAWHAGMWVNKGQFLATTTLASGCDGRTGGHHVHFWLKGVNPNGSTFGGWTLQDPKLVKGSVTKRASLSCPSTAALLYEGNTPLPTPTPPLQPTSTPTIPTGPANYAFCAWENQRCAFSGTKDVAYGANGSFAYRYNVSGGIDCNNGVFGDPAYGIVKACFTRPIPTVFSGNVSSALAVTTDQVRLEVCADNLPGHVVYATLYRGIAQGNPAKLWHIPEITAPVGQRCITFVDMDGAGPTYAGVTYYTVASLQPISDADGIARRTSCFSATGGRQLCDARSR